MKNLLLVLFSVLSIVGFSQSNSDELTFERKGKYLIETGYGGILGTSGSGTGASVLIIDDESFTQLKIEGGYFVTEDFAFKATFGFYNFFQSVKSFGAGGKFYLGGKAPLDFTIQRTVGEDDDDSQNVFSGSIGYAVPLAQNIYLEPSIGFLKNLSDSEDELVTLVNLKFALIL